jgi:hypothetical protein
LIQGGCCDAVAHRKNRISARLSEVRRPSPTST